MEKTFMKNLKTMRMQKLLVVYLNIWNVYMHLIYSNNKKDKRKNPFKTRMKGHKPRGLIDAPKLLVIVLREMKIWDKINFKI
jgi:hypothetical protein